MKNLITALKNEYKTRLNKALDNFYDDLNKSEKLTWVEKYTLNRKEPYKKNRAKQVEARLKQIYNKQLQEKLDQIEAIEKAHDSLPNDLVLTVNFYKSRTWGWCPKGNDNYGHETSSITGCGYCKESTATAQLLNQCNIILKRLYKAKNQAVEGKNSEVLGYGSGHGILPSFEGGVGVSCHISILEGLGFKVTQSGNDKTTVLVISENKGA